MFDVEKLVGIVYDLLEAEAESKEYNLKIRKEKGYEPDDCLWIPSLNGSEAYRLGELSERRDRSHWILADVCTMLDVDKELLIAAVKSIQRWQKHGGKYDRCIGGYSLISAEDGERLARFIKK